MNRVAAAPTAKAMHEDHVGTSEIEAAILITIDDERPVVYDELEVETADGTAGIARARRSSGSCSTADW